MSLTLQDGIWMAPTMSEQGSTYASRCATEELSELSDCYRSYRKKLDSARTSSHRISYRSYRKRYRTAIGKELLELSNKKLSNYRKSYRKSYRKRAIGLSELSDAIEPGLSVWFAVWNSTLYGAVWAHTTAIQRAHMLTGCVYAIQPHTALDPVLASSSSSSAARRTHPDLPAGVG